MSLTCLTKPDQEEHPLGRGVQIIGTVDLARMEPTDSLAIEDEDA